MDVTTYPWPNPDTGLANLLEVTGEGDELHLPELWGVWEWRWDSHPGSWRGEHGKDE